MKRKFMNEEGRNQENNDILKEQALNGCGGDEKVSSEEQARSQESVGEQLSELLGETNIEDLKKQLTEMREEAEKKSREICELKDLMQRRQADFENYKKRVIKGQEEMRKLAIKDFALDIISINDDLLRAIEASSSVKEGESLEQAHMYFVEGVKMISKMIEETLKKYGIEEINHLGKPFDPQYNEAVEIICDDSVKEETITKIYQKGFCLGDLVIRSARVQVTKPASQKTVEEASVQGEA
ncbi:MAG: nucleotide exchange factor GrpE [Spirochaetes bacterium]|nr:nucleotide exchange factor GrpE [Spirochaetota bacterium]